MLPIVIFGPTATGKTALAVALAEKLGSFIISADSMQVYSDLDIGSGKPTPMELASVKHFLVGIRSPIEPFNAGEFVRHTLKILEENSRIKHPVIAGGTGMYLFSLIHGIHGFPEIDPVISTKLEGLSTADLRDRLEAHDPDSASLIGCNDRKRITRALQIFMQTGRTYSSWIAGDDKLRWNGNAIHVNLTFQRSVLYDRISARVDTMFANGWISEVHRLLEKFPRDAYGFRQAIGYSDIIRHIDGELNLDETLALIKRKTCNYAKKQETWFNKFPGGLLLRDISLSEAMEQILAFIAGIVSDETGKKI
ncbi:MAG: tRNA (adenosine(37)-N6)-dimethylallyltransferase MiaA [Candidatus Wallbacteria bacterium]|nr:tRNA (adenosine(37)-N6)-dimethylallyltransferase MiaA [Candidatus Wallbacteria bacterium]